MLSLLVTMQKLLFLETIYKSELHCYLLWWPEMSMTVCKILYEVVQATKFDKIIKEIEFKLPKLWQHKLLRHQQFFMTYWSLHFMHSIIQSDFFNINFDTIEISVVSKNCPLDTSTIQWKILFAYIFPPLTISITSWWSF